MALFEEQITDTLETGAPPIKYEGDEGPQDPRQERMIAQLKEEYMQYVFEMRELEEPIMSFEEWYQSVYKASQMGAQAPQEEMMSEEMMMREPAAYGGIMDTDSGRRAYGLGSFFKKITKIPKKIFKGVKKIAKSPLGKIGIGALLAGPALGALTGKAATGSMIGMGPLHGATKVPWYKKGLMKGIGTLAKKAIQNPKTLAKIGIGAAPLLALSGIGTTPKEEYIADQGAKFDYDYNKMRDRFAKAETEADFAAAEEEFPVTPGLFKSRFYDMKADGGRIGFALGSKADFAIEDVMTGGVEDEIGGITGIMRQADLQRKGNVGQFYAAEGGMPMMMASNPSPGDELNQMSLMIFKKPLSELTDDEYEDLQEYIREKSAQGGRIGAREGGIMDLGGMEKDYRETGGFVDIGAEEKADDVPARLSVNEFVMTADAVRGAGDGDIDLGAERMEDTMKQLEEQGKRNQGASEMFEVSERLSEVV